MRDNQPGLVIDQIAPSAVSPNQRTSSPPIPSLLVHVRMGRPPCMRVSPALAPTHNAPRLSRRMFQTRLEARPCALVQPSHAPLPRQRTTPAPANPIQSDPWRSSNKAVVTDDGRPRESSIKRQTPPFLKATP